ncbi:MAG: hypothetical protein GX614_12825 [Sandaracinaceae bacterium]|nr:hypothetical protein [Sandaracinaceae bacterium]
MGAGSTTLLWYAVCIIVVCFIAIVATGLIIYGQAVEARRGRRRLREKAQAVTGENDPSDNPPLDPDDPAR